MAPPNRAASRCKPVRVDPTALQRSREEQSDSPGRVLRLLDPGVNNRVIELSRATETTPAPPVAPAPQRRPAEQRHDLVRPGHVAQREREQRDQHVKATGGVTLIDFGLALVAGGTQNQSRQSVHELQRVQENSRRAGQSAERVVGGRRRPPAR